jgi:hypothetical protein
MRFGYSARMVRPEMADRSFGADYSPCGRYRYALWREWQQRDRPTGQDTVLWIMLNPSRADHLGNNDPTIERCERRSVAWGFGRMEVVNLFGLRSPYPAALRAADDPIGPGNDASIAERAEEAGMVLCAWGALGALHGRADAVRRLLANRPLHCLGRTKAGEPAHPLYLPYGRMPEPYGWE